MTLFPEHGEDKLMLVFLLLLCVWIGMICSWRGFEEVLRFVMDAGKQILAALLTLMVGNRMMRRKEDQNGPRSNYSDQ